LSNTIVLHLSQGSADHLRANRRPMRAALLCAALGGLVSWGSAAQAQRAGPLNLTYTADSPLDRESQAGFNLNVVDANDSFTQSGLLSTLDNITKLGAGTLILTSPVNRILSLNKSANIQAGTLVMNGRFLDAGFIPDHLAIVRFNVAVQSGAILAGNGAITALTVNSGGTVSPGAAARGAIGTLTTGNVTLNAGSVLLIEVDATTADRINAVVVANSPQPTETGAVALNCATLRVADTAGDPTSGQVHTIITAAGGVTGTFGTVMDDYAFFDAAVSYEANAVKLTMTRNATNIASVAGTPNQSAAAGGLNSLPAGSEVVTAVLGLSGSAAQAAYDNLSGEVHADVQGRAVEGASDLGGAVLDHLAQGVGEGAGSGTGSGTGSGGNNGLNFSSRGETPAMGAAGGKGPQFWGKILANASTQSRSDGFAAAGTGRYGLMGGVDFATTGDWTFGAVVAASQTRTTMSDRSSDATTTNTGLGLYAGRDFGDLSLGLGLIHDIGRTEAQRRVSVGGLSQTLSSSYNTATTLAFAEIAGKVPVRFGTLTPFLRLSHAVTQSDAFTETGGSAALSRASQTSSATIAEVGIRGAADFKIAGKDAVLTGGIRYQSVISGGFGTSLHGFAAGSNAFNVGAGVGAGQAVGVDLGLKVKLSDATDLDFSYAGTRAGGVDNHQIGAAITMKF